MTFRRGPSGPWAGTGRGGTVSGIKSTRWSRMRKGERGQTLVLVALMMPALLGMLGLVIDVGNDQVTVKAVGEAIYGTSARVYLDWTKTGVMVMPLAFDVEGYQNAFNPAKCGASFGSSFNYSLYIETPTDCALGSPDTHFSF